jgi:hypothetical protein
MVMDASFMPGTANRALSTVQYCIALQYSTAQHSAAQHSTVQSSAVEGSDAKQEVAAAS